MKVALHTLGCKLNFSETSTLARQFGEKGFVKVGFRDKADVYVLNTCSVTENADKKCKKLVRDVLKINPEAYVIIMGCYAQLKPTAISEIPGVDLVLGAKDKFRLFEIVSDFKKVQSCQVMASEIGEVSDFKQAFSLGDRTRSFLKIQDGCDYKCTFCTIPLARGKSRSDSLENIVANAREIASKGIREIVLTGVNIGDYGKDQPGTFFDVVKALDEVEGIDRFRISSIEPNLLTDEIIEFVARSKRFMPHFHIPLQSGHDDILKMMRRRYKRDVYVSRVNKIKAEMPHACIGVDAIVGFPGESDAHFEETYRFLNELEVSYLHVFTYSERDNTPAPELENQVPIAKRRERSKMLRGLSDKKRRYFYQQFEAQIRPILFEGTENNGMMNGFTDNYIKVELPNNPELANQILNFELSSVNAEGLMQLGELKSTSHKLSVS